MADKETHSQIKKGVFLSYVSVGISTFSGLVFTPLLIRVMGQDQYGLYELIGSLAAYMSILNLGFGTTVVRYVSYCRAKGDKRQEASILAIVMRIYSISALVVLLAGSIIYFNLNRIFAQSLTADELSQAHTMLVIAVVNIAVSIPGGLFNSYITAYEKHFFARGITILQTLARLVVILLLLAVGCNATTLVIVDFAVTIFHISANVIYARRVLNIEIKLYEFDRETVKQLFGFSSWILLNMVIDQINWKVDETIIGIRLSTGAVAVYVAGRKISRLFQQLSTSISGVFLPRVTNMVASDASKMELTMFMVRVGRIQGMILLCVYTAFAVIGNNFVLLWLGSDFVDSWLSALLVMTGLLLPLMQNAGLAIMQATNTFNRYVMVYLAVDIGNIILTWLLTPRWGVCGAAFASMICYTLGPLIFATLYYHVKLKLNMQLFYRNILSIFLVPLICGFLLHFFKQGIGIETWGCFIIVGCVYVAMYFVLSWFITLNKEEKALIKGIVKRRK